VFMLHFYIGVFMFHLYTGVFKLHFLNSYRLLSTCESDTRRWR
jgi:hypothetical protein